MGTIRIMSHKKSFYMILCIYFYLFILLLMFPNCHLWPWIKIVCILQMIPVKHGSKRDEERSWNKLREAVFLLVPSSGFSDSALTLHFSLSLCTIISFYLSVLWHFKSSKCCTLSHGHLREWPFGGLLFVCAPVVSLMRVCLQNQ